MQAYLEAFRAALSSLSAHRMRSFLTTLGILIGTASVIAVVSLVQGFSASISNQFADLGGNTLSVEAQNDNDNFRTGKINTLTAEDVDALRYRVTGIQDVAPTLVVPGGLAGYRGRSSQPQVIGTTAAFQQVRSRFPQVGRFLVPVDDAGRRHVAVIGTKVREELHLPANPVGQYIKLGGDWFKVVGMMEPKGEVFGFSQDNYVVIPFEVARGMNGNTIEPMIGVSFTVRRIEELDGVRERARRALRASRGLKPGTDDDFKIEAASSVKDQLAKITSTATAVLGGIVGISLLVGGIGIMNIMLVSVTERTREIGILKALGATRRDILVQFLLEAALLALLGGVIGIVLGYAAGAGIAMMIPNFPPASVPLWVVLVAAGFSALVGVVFGLMPASKAAGLDPIEALRYE
ncbi:ABC transporter permease [Lysobacter sp. TY2-98]|uniref:ABC transporter permease n=1 Tax=Lysobacter sp. TY2-98 TaxID=2290922 RepID=UPI000E20A9BD|nr:ABC transporter permease [Lysobacter sp. TY2-98]AXK73220.1 ABC transporter permease [Lysobacter sp. TY2-98]